MSLQELKIVINDIIDDYNLDIWSLVAIIAFGVYTFLLAQTEAGTPVKVIYILKTYKVEVCSANVVLRC